MDRPSDVYFPRFDKLRTTIGSLPLPRSIFDKEIDLLSLEPAATSSMAAVILVTRMLVRKDWTDEAELSPSDYEKLSATAPSVPRSDDPHRFLKRDYRYRGGNERRVRCTTCVVKGGLLTCGVCEGSGKTPSYVEHSPTGEVCTPCRGSGLAPCHVCTGTGECIVVNMHYTSDSPIEDRRVVMPSLVGDLDDNIARAIGLIPTFPEAFRVDLQPTMIASAYRGAMSAGKPELFGFDYLDAWDRARASLPKSPPNTILREDEAWGWPFLCVRWLVEGKSIDAGIVVDETGSWRAVFATKA